MPTLDWIGKQAVVRHHAEVPFHLLKEEPELSCGGEAGAGNLIVQGDNLKALKALLPHYGGQVKCIYIDPPYNTGNEGWVYNDNVNSPEIKRWLADVIGQEAAKVGKEGNDLCRHDKWLCMMYPRLMLLKRFLSQDGVIVVSLDNNEIHHLRLILDEIFGSNCFVTSIVWRSSDNSNNDAKQFSADYNHTVIYSRSPDWTSNRLHDVSDKRSHFKNPDGDPRGPWFDGNPLNSPNRRENLMYHIEGPAGFLIPPPKNGWRWSKETLAERMATGEIRFTTDGKNIRRRTYLADMKGLPPSDLWTDLEQTGHNRQAKYEIMDIFGTDDSKAVFTTPKPVKLLERIIQITTNPGDLILDSFAGSGTTAHAVLKRNGEDTGNRRFILVEMDENIAQNITAERVRRVAQGYVNAKGEKVPGLGSGFRFAKLGKTLFDEAGAIREDVKFRELAEFVYFHHTGSPIPKGWKTSPLLGIVDGRAIYLLYNGILADRSVDGGNVLTAPILAALPPHNGPKTIYATACRIGPNRLMKEGIQFKQTPYALRVD